MDRERIIKRLQSFGYEYDEQNDAFSLDFAMEKVKNHILNNINCSEIPEKLNEIAIDMACAEFLRIQKGFGKLDNIDFELIAHNIKLGDANVQFSNEATPEQQFDAAIGYLLNGHEDDFAAHRKMVW